MGGNLRLTGNFLPTSSTEVTIIRRSCLGIQPEPDDGASNNVEPRSSNDLEGHLVVGRTTLEAVERDLLVEPPATRGRRTRGEDDGLVIEPSFDLKVGKAVCCNRE